MLFVDWLDTFVEEKGIDTDEEFIIEGKDNTHFVDVAQVLVWIKQASDMERREIKKTIVYLDFKNGDLLDYFRFLAMGYIDYNLEPVQELRDRVAGCED